MIFLSPYILLGLSLGILPIAIHLLVRRPSRRIDFPTLKFLQQTKKFRLRFRRIQQPLLLALRLGALLLLVLGLSRPILTFIGQGSRDLSVIVLDASLSMNAAGRAEAAREEAAKIINSLRPDERAAIITSDENTKTLINSSPDRKLLLSVVEHFKPGFGGIDYKNLLMRADKMISREMPGTKGNIYLISDFQQSGLMPGFDTVSPVKLLPVGKELDTNSYIRDVTPGKQVRNIELDSTEIIEDSNGSRAISKDVVLATPEGVANGIEWKTEQKSICGQAGVSTPDAFKEDNTRYFCFDLPQIVERGRVLLVDSQSDSAVYFRAALDSADSELPDGFDLNSQGSLDEVRDHLSEYKLIIWSVHGVPQAEEIEALRRYYENGGAILFSLSADLNLNRWNEFLEDEEARWLPFKTLSRLTADEEKAARLRIEITDPAATPFRAISDGALNSLPSVVMKSGYALGISETAFPLARWNNHMVAAAMTRSNINGHGFALVLGASPQTGAGDLGRSGAFPALVTSIAKSSLDASLRAHNFNIGAPIDIRLFINNDLLPQQKVDITRVSSGTEAPGHTTTPGMLLSNPESVIQNPGIYLLNAGDQKIWIAVNPPVNESSQLLAPVDSLKNLFRISSQNKQNDLNGYIEVHEEKNGLWLYCFLASIILLTVELVLSSNPRQPAEQATA